MANEKPRFIRKNGKIIPIGVDKNGKTKEKGQRSNFKKKGDSYHAKKSSYYEGRSHRSMIKAKGMQREKGKRAGWGFNIGAVTGLIAGKKGHKLMSAITGGIVGMAAGSLTSKHSGRDIKKHIQRGEKDSAKAMNHYGKIKNKDILGDGSSRRYFQRGLMGKKLKGSSV